MTNLDGRLSKGEVSGRLAGKVAVVTGAALGQGRAVTEIFARAGATVFACDVNEVEIEALARFARSEGLAIHAAALSAVNEAAMNGWIDEAADRYGSIDILYNNAAATALAPFDEMTLEQWRFTLTMELDIAFIPTKAVWRHMAAKDGGSIINVASVSGMRGTEFLGASAHAAGKAGLIGWTRQLALEGAPNWIRANSISPGPILGEAAEHVIAENREFAHHFNGWPLLRRTGRPIDIAYAGLFLASDESAFITGTNLVVDGGWTAKGGFTPHS